MNGWIDWRAIERQNDWGLRETSDAMCALWDEDAEMWDKRWKAEECFTQRQALAMDVLPSDSVIDIGCGAGPLALFVAPRVQELVAFDCGEQMLAILRDNAHARGISNIQTIQGNWYEAEPGRDFPVCDVAITRWSPAQGDILKFSRCARRYCYSVSSCAPAFEKDGFSRAGYWCRSTVDETMNRTPRPCARKYGFNVHFNLLYDAGANPVINYIEEGFELIGDSKEAVFAQLAERFSAEDESSDTGRPTCLPFENKIMQRSDGTWYLNHRHRIVIMGWDPREITYE